MTTPQILRTYRWHSRVRASDHYDSPKRCIADSMEYRVAVCPLDSMIHANTVVTGSRMNVASRLCNSHKYPVHGSRPCCTRIRVPVDCPAGSPPRASLDQIPHNEVETEEWTGETVHAECSS